MPATLSYPGVYIEEIPSGVRTITGVATSITAFVGRTWSGPTDKPLIINSFGDFERHYGGVRIGFPLSYAVKDFYLNGGSQAVIARLYQKDEEKTGVATVKADEFILETKNPGSWGDKVTAEIDTELDKDAKTRLGVKDDKAVFNLTILVAGKKAEKYLNLTDDVDNTRYIQRVLSEESNLVIFSTIDKNAKNAATELKNK